MPRLQNWKEKQHQPIWDTIIRTTGTPSPAIAATAVLFGNANVGNTPMTNLQMAGQLASNQVYLVMALRAFLFFDGTNARTFYQQVTSQLFFTFSLGDKPQFVAPCWYHPAGGGVHGFDSANAVFNHGTPSQEAILKLAKPIAIPQQQNIQVFATFNPVGTTDIRTLMNAPAADDQQIITYMIDGLRTRDVQ